MPVAAVNGTTLFYRRRGDGPDLVLIHGLSGDHACWYLRLLPSLAADFRVTLYDLRGHGLSAAPRSGYSSAVMAADLGALLDRLGMTGAHLAGHSFGGLVALQLAHSRPDLVRSLTIADTRIDALQPASRLSSWSGWSNWKKLTTAGAVADGDAALDFRLLETLTAPSGRAAAAGGWLPSARNQQRWKRLLSTTNASTELGARAGVGSRMLRSIRQPTQLLYGELSFCLPSAHSLLRLLQQSRLRVVPGVGHFFPVTRPRLFETELRHFLAQQ